MILADNEAYKGFLPGLLKVSLSLQKEIVFSRLAVTFTRYQHLVGFQNL